jgi:hypothetical protein
MQFLVDDGRFGGTKQLNAAAPRRPHRSDFYGPLDGPSIDYAEAGVSEPMSVKILECGFALSRARLFSS